MRALVVDDDEQVRYAVRGLLEHLGVVVDEASDGVEGLEKVDASDYQVVVTDIHMPRMDGLELLARIQRRTAPRPKVIVVTAHGTERQAVLAIKGGAFDYFKKPFEVDEILAVLRRAIESIELTAKVEQLEGELTLAKKLVFGSTAMKQLAVLVQRVAPREVTVLLTGESGTGKERIAEALVLASRRADKPFVRFNCATVTAELAEAELFGHSKGAFTGAVKARPGLFREADGGTILLDEIGELPPAIQAKLLRVLQEGEVRPVGEEQPIKVDVRIIAATHRDLLQMAGEGKFREDLYYRLKVVHLQLPALRERPEDIALLARHFLGEFAHRFGVGPFKLAPALLERLTSYAWPGNVRELKNALESAVALSVDDQLDLGVLPGGTATRVKAATASDVTDDNPRADLKVRMDAYERGIIVRTLDQTRGNRSRAARVLGVNRATLQGKLRKYGLAGADADLDDAE